jgi:hypothetical protein
MLRDAQRRILYRESPDNYVASRFTRETFAGAFTPNLLELASQQWEDADLALEIYGGDAA